MITTLCEKCCPDDWGRHEVLSAFAHGPCDQCSAWTNSCRIFREDPRFAADAARYRYIKKHAVWRSTGECVTWDLHMERPNTSAEHLTETSVGEELDAAIDAVRASD